MSHGSKLGNIRYHLRWCNKRNLGFSRGAPEKKSLFEVSFFGIKIDEYEYKNIISFIQKIKNLQRIYKFFYKMDGIKLI